MSLRPEVEAQNYQTMRVNLFEAACTALPQSTGMKLETTVQKGTIVARTVGASQHYENDIDSLIRTVKSDLATARKFRVSVVAERVYGGIKFTITS